MSPDIFDRAAPMPGGYREAGPETVAPFLGRVRVIDVREPDEYVGELGHIPGSELIPLGGVLSALADGDRDETIVLVCRSGGRSGHASQALARMGYRRLVNLAGGIIAWNANRQPVVHGSQGGHARV